MCLNSSVQLCESSLQGQCPFLCIKPSGEPKQERDLSQCSSKPSGKPKHDQNHKKTSGNTKQADHSTHRKTSEKPKQLSSTDCESSVDEVPGKDDQVSANILQPVESDAGSMHDSMPELITDLSKEQDNVTSPESYEADSGNSEIQLGDPQVVMQQEYRGELIMGFSESDDGNVLWGSRSSSSNETQHGSDDGVVLGINDDVLGVATSDSDSVDQYLMGATGMVGPNCFLIIEYLIKKEQMHFVRNWIKQVMAYW